VKRYAALGALLSLGVIACQQGPVAPTPQACAVAATDSSSSVTSTINFSTTPKALDPNKVETLGNDIYVNDPTNSLTINKGDVIASNCNEGLLRRVTNASAQTSSVPGRAGPLAIRKVYLQTEDIALENIVSDGDASIDYGNLPITNANTTSTGPGVRVQDLTATLTIKDFRVPVSVGSLTFNGSVQSTLNPVFKLQFAGGKVKTFEASLNGNLNLNIVGTLQATAGVGVGKEATIWKGSYTRAFLLGAVPMVVVIEPQLIAGANVNLNGTASLTAGIKPTFNAGFGVKYDGATGKWASVGTKPTFALNPSFEYSAKTTGNASAYVRFAIGVKFYGAAGPTIEARPNLNLELFPNQTQGAKLTAGVTGSVGVTAGFKVLGAGLAVAYSDTIFDPKTIFDCTYNTAQAKYVCAT
jgi:hypothetical protein